MRGLALKRYFFFGQAHTISGTAALVESGQDEQLWILRLSFDFFLPIRRIFQSIGADLYFLEVVVGPQLMRVVGAVSRTGWVLILDLQKTAVQLVEGGLGRHF